MFKWLYLKHFVQSVTTLILLHTNVNEKTAKLILGRLKNYLKEMKTNIHIQKIKKKKREKIVRLEWQKWQKIELGINI